MPLTFLGNACGFGGGDSVVGGMGGVTGNMGGCSSVASGARGGTSRSMISIASSSVGGKCGSTDPLS